MAYTKNNWQTGDVITATKLNHMEDGIGDSNMIVNVTTTFPSGISEDDQLTNIQSDKTILEILSAIQSGKIVTLKLVSDEDEANTYFLTLSGTEIYEDEQEYSVFFQNVRCNVNEYANFHRFMISFELSEGDEEIYGYYDKFSCDLRSQA